MGQRSKRLMIPLHKASRLCGGHVECSPRRSSTHSGVEDCHGEVDVLPELIVERCARCEQQGASKGEGRTWGAALSPWRYGRRERERQGAPYGGAERRRGPRWLEMSHAVARLSGPITAGFERGNACRQSVLHLASWGFLNWCQATSGVVWCGVVCRRRYYQMAKGRDVYPRAKVNGLGCVCSVRAVCRYVALGRRSGEAGKTWPASPWRPSVLQDLPLHPFSFRLLVQAQLLQRPRHGAAVAQAGLQHCGARLHVSVPDRDGLLHHVSDKLNAQRVAPRALQVGPLHGGGPQGRRPLL